DFAILISSGLSTRAALCANFLSACSAYIGLIIGLAIGEVPEGALYVFAVTAGLFIYISVSDMLPSMRQSIEKVEKRKGTSYKVFLLQMLGFFVGFGCVIGVTISSDYINLTNLIILLDVNSCFEFAFLVVRFGTLFNVSSYLGV
ncbi:unnamed protein product, partial [Dibothriocephalus latus]